MLLRQLSYAIKTQIKAPEVPYWGLFLPFAGSLGHKDKEPAADASEMTSDSQIETYLQPLLGG